MIEFGNVNAYVNHEVAPPFLKSDTVISTSDYHRTVVDDSHISYKGVTTSTSVLAKELLESEYPVQGTAYFTYAGERLTERRDRMEEEKEMR